MTEVTSLLAQRRYRLMSWADGGARNHGKCRRTRQRRQLRDTGSSHSVPTGSHGPMPALPLSGIKTQEGKRTMKKVKDLLRSGKLTVFEVLQQVSLEELGEAVTFLKRHRPKSEVCRALEAIIATSPLSEFQTLQVIYRRHCG